MPAHSHSHEAPVYSRCSAGIGRWFWAAWDSWSEARAGEPAFASGYAANADAAEAKAIESAGPRAKPLAGKWASQYRRRGAEGGAAVKGREEKRPTKRVAVAVALTRVEFLYCAYASDESDAIVVDRHRIVKQNARKIHVDREPFREGPCEEDRAPRTLIVDRDTLRREGRYRHPRSHRVLFFYTSREAGVHDVEATRESSHSWCATLGVRFPGTIEDVKAAYRRLAKESHPDAGGDPNGFRILEQAYRDALAYYHDRASAAS